MVISVDAKSWGGVSAKIQYPFVRKTEVLYIKGFHLGTYIKPTAFLMDYSS